MKRLKTNNLGLEIQKQKIELGTNIVVTCRDRPIWWIKIGPEHQSHAKVIILGS